MVGPAFASTFEMERPSAYVVPNERVENANADSESAVGIGVHVNEYFENSPSGPFFENDGFILRVVGTANTRKGIWYECESSQYDAFPSRPWLPNELVLGDDEGAWVDIGFSVAFYTGPCLQNSSLYSKVWLCSNGFLCFEGEYTNPSPPSVIPNCQSPNAFIAPYWSDLNPSGGTIRYGGFSYGVAYYFGVEWDVIDEANGEGQNFAVYIQKNSPYFTRKQNTIIFQYWDVSWSGNAFWGIEDQEGYKGVGGRYPISARSLEFQGWNANWEPYTPEIREMTIKLEKQDDQAEIYIGTDFWELSSCNLQWKAAQPAPEPWYYTAIRGGATLLMSTAIGMVFGPVGGLMFGTTVVGYETAEAFSKSLWQAQEANIKQHANTTENLAYVSVPTAGTEEWKGTQLSDYPVDTLIGAQIYWIFTDDNTEPHELKITVELKYYNYYEEKTIQTSVVLNVVRDAGNSIDNPNIREISPGTYIAFVGIGIYSPGTDDIKDFYKIWVKYYQTINIKMQPPKSANINFDLHLYNPNKILVASSTNGPNVTEQIVHLSTHSDGYWYIEVNATLGSGLYTLSADVYWAGCPFLYVWNGADYVIDNNLLAASEVSNGVDVEDYYKLEQPLVPKHQTKFLSLYSLQIKEFENEHSYLDQVKLLAIDHEPEVNVAVSSAGEILTYKNPYPPVICIDNYGNDLLDILTSPDNQYYIGHTDDYILLDFGNLDISNGAKLVLRTDWPIMPKCPCIKVQVLDSTGNWIDVTTISPRVYWATDIIDLSNYLSNTNEDIKIRLYFTNIHKIDYIGLDTTPQTEIHVTYSHLISAMHSEEGPVTFKLLRNDKNYAELVPNQQITLTFLLPRNPKHAERTFIFYTEGHYHTITPENP